MCYLYLDKVLPLSRKGSKNSSGTGAQSSRTCLLFRIGCGQQFRKIMHKQYTQVLVADYSALLFG